MTVSNKTILKIQKLLNMSESAKEIGSAKEAEAFAAAASKLMAEHALSLSEIELKDEQEEGFTQEEIHPEAWGMHDKSRRCTWAIQLAQVVANSNFCSLFTNSNCIVFVGKQEYVSVATYVFHVLINAKWKLSTAAYRNARKNKQNTKGFFTSYNFGFVDGVKEALRVERVRLEESTDEAGLIRIDSLIKAADDYIMSLPGMRRGPMLTRSVGNSSAYGEGKQAGLASASTSRNRLLT